MRICGLTHLETCGLRSARQRSAVLLSLVQRATEKTRHRAIHLEVSILCRHTKEKAGLVLLDVCTPKPGFSRVAGFLFPFAVAAPPCLRYLCSRLALSEIFLTIGAREVMALSDYAPSIPVWRDPDWDVEAPSDTEPRRLSIASIVAALYTSLCID